MKHKSILSIAFILLVTGACASILADSWRLPEKAKYYSSNKTYCFEVIPRKLESQLKYFEDKVEGRKNAGSRKEVKDNRAKGVFYARRADGQYTKKWEFPLENEVSPVDAIVSSNGNFVVTFDNWHSVGYGDNVVVIYRSKGELVKKLGLKDLLTEGDIDTLPSSVSSIWWGGDHYIDEAKSLLVLKVVSNRKSPSDKDVKFHELKIELATGRPLEPKRDLFPQPRVVISVASGGLSEPSNATPSKPICTLNEGNFDSPEALHVPSEQLFARATQRPLPRYYPIAKATRSEGTVIIEVLVSKAGDVICARSLSGHPLLKESAVEAALKWKFEPIEVSGETVNVISTVAFSFKFGM